MNRSLRVKDVGEQVLLKRLQAFCPAEFVGDDAALLAVAVGHRLVVTTDSLIDGVHFSLGMAAPIQTTSPTDAGWRAAAANLSDLAAMGATPIGITIALGLPAETPVAWVEQIYQGITACLQPFNTPIVGGDLCRSPILSLNITALGQVLPQQTIHRSTAQPANAILVTGAHGASRAGLELLLHPEQGRTLPPTLRDRLIQSHQRPLPRLDAINLLKTSPLHPSSLIPHPSSHCSAEASYIPHPSSFPLTGMDSSDGLADAILQICRASGVGARLDRQSIPLPEGLSDWVGEDKAIEWALYGGEDFELVLCLSRTQAEAVLEKLGAGAAIVGEITTDRAVILQDSTGNCPAQVLSLDRGFQHFG